MNRRLYRCRHDRRLAGVASGVAEFFDLDPTLVRVLWFLSIFLYGLGVLLYVGLAIIVPLEPLSADATGAAGEGGTATLEAEGHRHTVHGDGRWTTFIGLGLILFGSMALLTRLLPAWDIERYLVPALAIGIGGLLVARSIRREPIGS
jgi:phage shock protein PspC (stress-responsive transcriptional regulator)